MKLNKNTIKLIGLSVISFLFPNSGKSSKISNNYPKTSSIKVTSIDNRINSFRSKFKQQLLNSEAKKTLLEFKKYAAGNEWVNWVNWDNWANWNNWVNWDNWNNWNNWAKFSNWQDFSNR